MRTADDEALHVNTRAAVSEWWAASLAIPQPPPLRDRLGVGCRAWYWPSSERSFHCLAAAGSEVVIRPSDRRLDIDQRVIRWPDGELAIATLDELEPI